MSSLAVSGPARLSGHDPAGYRPHALHGAERAYPESNCYADVIIELLHARGYDPLAALGHVVRVDFEGDQWTFFKPPAEDLELLFGIDVHEMQPYRPLPVQISEQLARDRTLIIELDSFYLPDTAATSYRTAHVKSSVAAEAIDPAAERFTYFHGPGLYELGGEDYRGVFRIAREFSADVLAPYTELVRFDARAALQGGELREAAHWLLARHLARLPESNPFGRFAAQLQDDLPALLSGSHEDYHAYAFATVRMAGAAFELAAAHAEFVLGPAAAPACAAMHEIVAGCKALSFRLARRKPFDPEPLLASLAAAWTQALTRLGEACE